MSERPVHEAIWDKSIPGSTRITSQSSKVRMSVVGSRTTGRQIWLVQVRGGENILPC